MKKNFAHYVPDKIIPNSYFEEFLETSDEWITQRTGIQERRYVENQNTTDLAYNACLNLDLQNVDAIIFATFTPDKFIPSCASILQKKLDLKNVACFDLNAACSGFIYSLQVAYSLISANQYKKILIVGAEVISKMLDFTDRNTCILFGDGAGAFLMDTQNYANFKYFYLNGISDEQNSLSAGNILKDEVSTTLSMNGSEVFKFAVRAVNQAITHVLNEAQMDVSHIKYFVAHQANSRIIEHVAKKLNINKNQVFINLNKYGNTSAASIPICLSELELLGELDEPCNIILVGFGGGLTYGSVLVEWKGRNHE